jgi:nucleotide-binding universal stress UspA family protein
MYKSILLPVDLGHESSWKKAAPVAVSLAGQYDAQIHIITVIPDYGMPVVGSFFPGDFAEKAKEATQKQLDSFVAEHNPAARLAEARVVTGTIYKRVIINADEMGCDLIVLASHRPEKADYLLGPNAARIVRHANQSVFVVR